MATCIIMLFWLFSAKLTNHSKQAVTKKHKKTERKEHVSCHQVPNQEQAEHDSNFFEDFQIKF